MEREPDLEAKTARLSWEQICEKFPDEWVVLTDIDWIDNVDYEFRTATVLGHSKGRSEVLKITRPLRGPESESAHLYTGTMKTRISVHLRSTR